MTIHTCTIPPPPRRGTCFPARADNLAAFLAARSAGLGGASIEELVARQAWGELNDRFYRYLEFGTGGMRGRTIGVVSTAAERGTGDIPLACPRRGGLQCAERLHAGPGDHRFVPPCGPVPDIAAAL
jgi:hypothetical protein